MGALAQKVIGEDECRHGFDDGDGAREHAGVVATVPDDFAGRSRGVDARLFFCDGRRRLERDAEVDFLAVGNAALDSAGSVGRGADFPVAHFKCVVVLGAAEARSRETASDFKALGGGNAKHGFGEIGFEAVKNRFAQTGGNAADFAANCSADGVAVRSCRFDARFHFFRDFGVRTAHWNAFDFALREKSFARRHCDFGDAFDVAGKFDFGAERGEKFFRDCAGGNASDGFAGGGASAAFRVAEAVFGDVGKIGVRGAELVAQFVVSLRAVVGVAHEQGDWRSRGLSLIDAGEDFDAVAFVARSGKRALSGTAAVELGLDFFGGNRQLRGTAVDDDTDACSVAFAEC